MKKLMVYSLSSLLLLTSCATILTGSSRKVLLESNPTGAVVYVNGMERGTTPALIKLKADDRLDFRLKDYKDKVVVVDSRFNLVAIINGVSLVGWGVDALTGSLRRVKTKYIKVDLDTQSLGVQGYLEKGRISKLVIDEQNQVIETTIVLE
ncbi:MAG: PEGA domain-containing protein [Flavobacteriaceae bacterium]